MGTANVTKSAWSAHSKYIYISQNLPNFPPHTIPNIQNKTEP